MSSYKYLDKINNPSDLKKLPSEAMGELSSEIRDFLVENVRKTGGHLASNLGTVELILAMHRVFDSPKDHFIFDVGHQAYTHKILTGRKNEFENLRKPGGLSGFTKRSESEHDPFGAGHSGTSLSASLGFAMSDKINSSDAFTVCVIGDGAYTGGMIHEALNNCKKNLKLIIILNENEMSISKNIGGFAKQIAKIRSKKNYYKVKDATRSVIDHIPIIGHAAFAFVRDTKQTIKNAMYDSNYFEEIGLYYLGPVDGNDYDALEDILQIAKGLNTSCVIHTVTKKGKGYRPAEQSPDDYHSILPQGKPKLHNNFSILAGNYLCESAKTDSRICAVTAAMTKGTGLSKFANDIPARFFDVGIAEEHAVTFCAGLAANGMKPFFAVYSSFLQRAYDNIIHDVALQNLPVTFLVDRAGLSSGDGATHHGIFDVSFLSGIPNMTIYTPITAKALKSAIDEALKLNSPCAIRYPNDTENSEISDKFYKDVKASPLGAKSDCREGCECVIMTYGASVKIAMKAEKILCDGGINTGIILLEKLKPYEECADNIEKLLPPSVKHIIFVEEGIKNGAAAAALSEQFSLREKFHSIKISVIAIEDNFVLGEKGRSMLESAGITVERIVEAAKKHL